MRRSFAACAAGIAMFASIGSARQAPNAQPYKVVQTTKVGGPGGTMEAFSSQRDGTLTVIKENSPASFVVEQNVQTMVGAKTLTLDSKTNHILFISAEYTPPPTPPAGGRAGRGQMAPDSFTILVVGR